MLRLSTGLGEKLTSAHSFDVNYGGAEANVGIALSNFGYDVSFVSKIPDSPLGEAVKKHLMSHGVKTDFILFGGERLGTYYLETGSGERSAKVVYDRKYSSFSKLEVNELEWESIFKDVDLFHVSGVAMAISNELRQIVKLAIEKAKELGVKISFDFNYRAGLWTHQEAKEAYREVLPYIDLCSAGELDAIHFMGIDKANDALSIGEKLTYYYREMQVMYPNIQCFSSTTRNVVSSSNNELTGNFYINGELYRSNLHHLNPIIDRVGGGDAFMSGILYGYLESMEPQEIITFATAASALKHTIHGDCNVFTVNEVKSFVENGSGKIQR